VWFGSVVMCRSVAERGGVEVGSLGYELIPVPDVPKKPALRIYSMMRNL